MLPDRELAFISGLLKSGRAEQEEFSARAIPLSLFRIRDREMAWIYSFRERHGVYPSPFLFYKKFELKLSTTGDPLTALLQPILDFEQYDQIRETIEKTNEMVLKDKPMPDVLSYFRERAANLKTYSVSSLADINWGKSDAGIRRYLAYRKNLRQHSFLMNTPWRSLNRLVRVLLPGELVTMYGRFGTNKSYISLHWAKHLAQNGAKVLFITKEMPTFQVQDRLEAMHLRLNWDRFRTATLSPKEFLAWRLARKKPLPFEFNISGDETIEGVGTDYVVRKIDEYKPDAVFVDGAYLLEVPWISRRAGENERLTALTRFFKRVAKAKKVLMFVITQMNRQGEDKTGKMAGGATTVFGSDSWGQDSDLLLEIGGKRNEPHYKKITIRKSRESGIGDFYVATSFDPVMYFGEITSPLKVKNRTIQIRTDIKLK